MKLTEHTETHVLVYLFGYLTNGNRAVFNHHVKDARGRLLSIKEGKIWSRHLSTLRQKYQT